MRLARIFVIVVGIVLISFLRTGVHAANKLPTIEVRASYSQGDRSLQALTTYPLSALVDPPSSRVIKLWAYHDRFTQPPPSLSSLSAPWFFPNGLSLSNIKRSAVFVMPDGERIAAKIQKEAHQGQAARGSVLTIRLPTERPKELHLTETFRLPERFARIGSKDDGQSFWLLAPWYPLPIRNGNVDLTAEHCATMRLNAPPQRARTQKLSECRTGGIPTFDVAKKWFRHRETVDSTQLEIWSRFPLQTPRPASASLSGSKSLFQTDRLSPIRTSLRNILRIVRWAKRKPPERLTLVFAPIKAEFGFASEDAIYLSSEAFEVTPIDLVMQFHQNQFRRLVYRHLARRTLSTATRFVEKQWLADLSAVFWMFVEKKIFGFESDRADELAKKAAIHPTLDQLSYAPQIKFREVYFGGISEQDRLYESPSQAFSPHALGRFLWNRIRTLPQPRQRAFQQWASADLLDPNQLRELVGKETLRSWLRSPSRLSNLRLVKVQRRKRKGKFETTAYLARDGELHSDQVTVRFVTRSGKNIDRTWLSSQRNDSITIRSAEEIINVQVDPERVYAQSSSISSDHPSGDDREAYPLRPPVFSGLSLTYLASQDRFAFYAATNWRKMYLIDYALGITAFANARSVGGLLSARYAFGLKRDDNNRRYRFAVTTGFVRLLNSFLRESGESRGRFRIPIGASLSYNSYQYFLDPHQGTRWNASVFGNFNLPVDQESLRFSLTLSGSASKAVSLGLWHSLTFAAGGSALLGDPVRNELLNIGSPSKLRAFEVDELLGRGILYGVTEYRYTPIRNLHWNIAQLVWVRRLQFGLFAGVGGVFAADMGQKSHAVGEIGGGLRVHFEYAGIQPGVLALDLAYPIGRIDDGVTRPPVTFTIAYDQYY